MISSHAMYNAGLVWPRLGKGRVITTISDSDEYIRSNSANRKCLKKLNSIKGNILVYLCHLYEGNSLEKILKICTSSSRSCLQSRYPIRFFKLSKDQNNWGMNPQSGSYIKILCAETNEETNFPLTILMAIHNIFICDPLWGFITQLFWPFDNLKNLIGYCERKVCFLIFFSTFLLYLW